MLGNKMTEKAMIDGNELIKTLKECNIKLMGASNLDEAIVRAVIITHKEIISEVECMIKKQ